MKNVLRRTGSFGLSLVLLLSAITVISPNSVSAFGGTGTGTAEDPFVATTCADLQSIGTDSIANQTEGKLYILGGNIDCSATSSWNGGLGFDPIRDFGGAFDGQGYTISDLTINRPLEDYTGLFGNTGGSDTIIANFFMTNADVVGRSYVGSVAGFSNGAILGVEVSGSVSGASAGNAAGTGGIVGRQQSTEVSLSRLGFTGTVNNTGSETGGILGTSGNASLENSYANATVTGTTYVGGLVGLVGSCCNNVSNSYAVGAVTGSNYVGGAIGSVTDMNETTVQNIFAASAITGTTNTGGVIGAIGSAYGPTVTIDSLYFDETAAGISDCYASAAVAATCTARNSDGLDTGHFYAATNAPLSSWDFENVWSQEVSDYPSLQPLDPLTGPGAVSGIGVTFPVVAINAEVTFNAPASSGSFPVNRYAAEIKLATAGWDEVITSENTGVLEPLNFSSLDFETDYTIRVRAASVYASGPWTEYSFTTGQQEQIDISSCEELQAFDESPGNRYAAIVLTQDIDCSGIADFNSLDWESGSFAGLLDGQGHTISNLSISVEDTGNVGMFTFTGNATIQNVSFNDAIVSGSQDSYYCGVVAGVMNETNISNIVVNNALVTCLNNVGGVAGRFESESRSTSEVENVSVSGEIHSAGIEVDWGSGPEINGGNTAGGLFGQANALYEGSVIISQSFSNATVVADQYSAGGLIGSATSEMDDDSVYPTTFIIQDSYASGTVTASSNAGGFIGEADSYNDGYDTTVEIEVENSYSSADVTAIDSAGGIIGFMNDPGDEGEQYVLSNVFSAGSTAADTLGYALIGGNDGLGDGSLSIINSYFDQTATGKSEASAYDDTISGWTAVNADATENDYFKNNSVNSPLDQWDFENTWQANIYALPTLRFSASNEDLNGDSIPDSEQPNVGGYVSPITGKIVAIDVGDGCELTTDDMTTEANLNVQDPAYEYQNGLWDFEADCGSLGYTTTIKLYYYNVDKTNLLLRKHNPKSNIFFTINDAVVSSQAIDGQNVTVVTYQVTDGGERDTDGVVDGMINDPAGLARSVVGVPNTGLHK